MLTLIGSTGCFSETGNDSLSLFASNLSSAESIEYSGIQETKTGGSAAKQFSHVEYTKDPFSLFQKIGTLQDGSFAVLENHLRDQGETADYFLKTFIIDPFSEEQLSVDESGDFAVGDLPAKDPYELASTLKGEEKQLMLQSFDQVVLYDIAYLIEKNIDTFQENKETLSDDSYTRYDGTISVDSVLDRYADWGRERIQARMKILHLDSELKSTASKEEMKDELTKLYDGVSIAEGIYELVFSEEAAPISIWIPSDDEKPYKVTIDYSDAYKNKNIQLFHSPSHVGFEKTITYSFFLH